jgi:phosphatidylglycerophosphate synthase
VRWKCTDELADAVVHRPLAGLIVRAVERTAVTPNHLTLLSMGFGLCSGLYLAIGSPLAAPPILLHLVFDCSDGQLARKRGPSRLGRVLDGLSDDVAGISMYLGLVAGGLPLPLALAAGASLLVRGMAFDGFKMLYQGAAEVPVYTAVQRRMIGPWPVSPGFLRLAGFAGATTHHVLLAVAALAGWFETFLAYALVGANAWLAVLMAGRVARGAQAAGWLRSARS